MHEDDRPALARRGVGAVGEEEVVPLLGALAAVDVCHRFRRPLPADQENRVLDALPLQALAQALVGLDLHRPREDDSLAPLGVLPLVQRREAEVCDRVLVALRLGDDRRPHGFHRGPVDLELRERAVGVPRDVGDGEVPGLELFGGVCYFLFHGGLL